MDVAPPAGRLVSSYGNSLSMFQYYRRERERERRERKSMLYSIVVVSIDITSASAIQRCQRQRMAIPCHSSTGNLQLVTQDALAEVSWRVETNRAGSVGKSVQCWRFKTYTNKRQPRESAHACLYQWETQWNLYKRLSPLLPLFYVFQCLCVRCVLHIPTAIRAKSKDRRQSCGWDHEDTVVMEHRRCRHWRNSILLSLMLACGISRLPYLFSLL